MRSDPPVKTLTRGLEVMDFVIHSSHPMRLKDVATALNMDRASTLRVLQTLEMKGYLVRRKNDRSYAPGHMAISFAYGVLGTSEIARQVRPILNELSDATGQVAYLGALAKNKAAIVDVALTATARVSVNKSIGDAEDLRCSAIGRVFVAFAQDARRAAILASMNSETQTLFTGVNAVALSDELSEITGVGIAFSEREECADVSSIAAPVFDASGACCAAVGVSAVASILDRDIRAQLDWISNLRLASTRISEIWS